MNQSEKLLEVILCGTSDANISFTRLCTLLSNLGFSVRVKGSHHIFAKTGIEEILNIQPKGAKAKPYQVKQGRNVIFRYKLGFKP